MAGCKQSQPLLRDDGFRALSLKCDGLKAKQKEYQNQIFVILAVLRRSMQRVTRPNTATTRLGYTAPKKRRSGGCQLDQTSLLLG